MFLEISQNSQENTCARVSFLIKACNFIKKETLAQVFSCEFCKFSKNTFFTEHLCQSLLTFQSLRYFSSSNSYFIHYLNEFLSSIINKLCIFIFMRSMKSLCRSVPTSQYIDCNALQDTVQYIMKHYRAILSNSAFVVFCSGSNNFHFILFFHHKVVITWSRFARMKFQPIQPEQISSYDYMGKSDFIPARRDSFPSGTCLDLYAFSLNFSLWAFDD